MQIHLNHLGLLQVFGKDAALFLQGQLTQNVLTLNEQKAQYALYCTKEGRVKANVILFKKQNHFYLILSEDLKEKIQNDLKKYILRSQVQIECENKKIIGRFETQNRDFLNVENDEIDFVENTKIIIEKENNLNNNLNENLNENEKKELFSKWKFLEIKNRLPWIFLKTTELFTPQMLSMEKLAVNFQKGCYIGQEVISRTHYLGKTKRKVFALKSNFCLNVNDGILNKQNEKCGSILYSVKYQNQYFALAVLNENDQQVFFDENKNQLEIF